MISINHGFFLVFGRFDRKIFGKEFWQGLTSRKSFGGISLMYDGILNFKYYKKSKKIGFFPLNYANGAIQSFFVFFLYFFRIPKLNTTPNITDIDPKLFLGVKYCQNPFPKIFRPNRLKTKKNPMVLCGSQKICTFWIWG